jgi:hypothetical protein
MYWLEIKCNAPPEFIDPISNRLFEMGAEGIAELENGSLQAFFAPHLQMDELPLYFRSLEEMNPETDWSYLQQQTDHAVDELLGTVEVREGVRTNSYRGKYKNGGRWRRYHPHRYCAREGLLRELMGASG